MKIVSLNVNGLRSALSKGFFDWVKANDFDVICLQEVKATLEQLELQDFKDLGYYFYLNPAQKKGYSGVGIFTKIKPRQITFGMGIQKYDDEGRVLRIDFDNLSVMSVYIPSGSSGDLRQEVKMDFLKDFTPYINDLKNHLPRLIMCGDFNICHKAIDINRPNKHTKMSGFLPEEREWFDHFLEIGLIDTFRVFNNLPDQYTWWSYRARAKEKNLGWRIDYCVASEELRSSLKSVHIYSELNFSDHCPILLELDYSL